MSLWNGKRSWLGHRHTGRLSDAEAVEARQYLAIWFLIVNTRRANRDIPEKDFRRIKMLKKIFRSFSSNKSTSSNVKKSANAEKSLSDFLKEEISTSSYIKPDNRELVHDAIIKRTYLKSGAALSADEKRAIGLNPRYKFYQAQLDALTQEGLKVGSSHAFSVIELRAQSRHARIQNQIDMLKSGVVTQLEIASPSGDRDCTWCKQQDGKKYPLNVDIDKLIQDNCTCEHCRLGLLAVVNDNNA